ncbi:TetR/AcrR family transcriptional regulator [[Mycobacterium] nativiensis]|uniref:TetR/AcrR family transcriptional regulator n=1 Tax=[Mycobacterium] nativiensis TaxID=2855503 RepID=A0ABU5XV41_9MYCO|nr:TetR/AcrR family transcriptional regulator [Mycolicibacter sp. MYC340]MEB3031845.1 TetR/AcrR family transcriptional regulator [Mycolicibacter sp. MYC340]
MSTTHVEPRTRGGRTRDAIRAAADECFRQYGFDATGAEIARRAGVVEGTVFLHYRSKLGLLTAVTNDFYDLLQSEAERSLARAGSVVERFRLLVDGWASRMETDWDLINVFVQQAQNTPDSELAKTMHARSRDYTRLFVAVIEELQADGHLPADTPAALLRDMVFGTLEHTVRGHISAGRSLDVRATGQQIIDLLLLEREAAPAADRLGAIESKLDRLLSRAGIEPD